MGIFVTGSIRSSIQHNSITSNHIGIGSHSSIGSAIQDNEINANDLAGITIVKSKSSKVETNLVGGSKNGIFLDYESQYNMVKSNNMSNNVVDINNADGLPLNTNQNNLLTNKCIISQPSGFCGD